MELQQHLDEFAAARIRLFAISYDPIEVLARFAERYEIRYPLLADDGSAVIRQLGILNTLVRPDESVYGIPFPGYYVLDEQGVVVEKSFNQRYQVRDAAQAVLMERFRERLALDQNPRADARTPQAEVSAILGASDLAPERTVPLVVRIDLAEGLHVYGPDAPAGYYATEVAVRAPAGIEVGEPAFPPTRLYRIEGLDESFEVIDGAVEIHVPLRSTLREGDFAPIEVEVRYQACNDAECFLPQTVNLTLDAPLGKLAPAADA